MPFMPHLSLIRLVTLLSQYGYEVLFPIAVFEGPAATMIAGALVATGELDAVTAFVVLVLADLVGDTFYYSVGRWGHTRFLEQIGKYLGLTQDRLRPLENSFRKHDWKLLLVGKTQALGSLVLYFAGAIRMSFTRFMAWNLLGTIPKTALFEMVGYFLGQTILHSRKYLDAVTILTFGVALLLLLIYWLSKKYLEREFTDPA
jgi:membrane protein DedA with SNARE-associated domain